MSTEKKRLFIGDDGANLVFTFILVSSLFFLWGVCNGMIDVMDKHFQEELNLNKAQSAWVQFAHYLGYFNIVAAVVLVLVVFFLYRSVTKTAED